MSRRYSLEQGMIDDHIMNLIQICGGSPHADLIKEIIVTALKLVEQPVDRGDIKILNAALRELRFAFRLFTAYRHVRKVTVFGSARTQEDDPAYHQAVTFTRKIAQHGYMVITGAGDGIMKGAQEGSGRQMSFGVNIQLPFEQVPNVFIENDPKLVTFKYFFTRKLIFMKEADAIVLFQGGFGTLDEGFEALTLMQTGKGDIMPVVMVDVPGEGYWKEWHRHLEKHLLRRALISPEDTAFFKVTDDVDEAVREVVTFYRNYHSSRYVRDRLIIRLQHSVTDEMLGKLNAHFRDILVKGAIERSPMLPEESNDLELAHLPRLSLCFNRKNFGRLRQMIDVINTVDVPRAVLFLCTGNSCRSQMAEGFARTMTAPGTEIYSAGIFPAGIHPLTVKVMTEAGAGVKSQTSKGLSAIPLDKIDTVITLCDHAKEYCPTFPGSVKRYHWPIDDPVKVQGTEEEVLNAFRRTRDEIRDRVVNYFRGFKSD